MSVVSSRWMCVNVSVSWCVLLREHLTREALVLRGSGPGWADLIPVYFSQAADNVMLPAQVVLFAGPTPYGFGWL